MKEKPDYLGLYCRIVVWGLFVLLLLACAYLFLLRSVNSRESEAAQRSFITLLNTQNDFNFTSKNFINKVDEQFQLHDQLAQSMSIRNANNNNLLNSFYRENGDLDAEGQLLRGFFNNIQYKKRTDYLNFSENNSVLALEAVYYVLPMSQLYNIVSLFFYICVTFLIATLVVLAALLRKAAATKIAATRLPKKKSSTLSMQKEPETAAHEQTASFGDLSQLDEDTPLNFDQNNSLFENSTDSTDLHNEENPFHILKEPEEKEGTKEEVESLFDFFDEEKVAEKQPHGDEQELSEIFDEAEPKNAETSALHSFPESLIPDGQAQEKTDSFDSLAAEQPEDNFEDLATEKPDSFDPLTAEQPEDNFEDLATEKPDSFDPLTAEQPEDNFEDLATEKLDSFDPLTAEQPEDNFEDLATEKLDSFDSLTAEQPEDNFEDQAREKPDSFDSLTAEQPEDNFEDRDLDKPDSFDSLATEQPEDSFEDIDAKESELFDSLTEEESEEYPFLAGGEQDELTQPHFNVSEKDNISDTAPHIGENSREENADDIFEDLENQLDKLGASALDNSEQPLETENVQDLDGNLSEAELLLGGNNKKDDLQSLEESDTSDFFEDQEEQQESEIESNLEADLHKLPSQALAETPLEAQSNDTEEQQNKHFSEEPNWQKFLENQQSPLSSLIDPLLAGRHDFSLSLLSAAQPLKAPLLERFDNEDLFFASEQEAIIVLRGADLANAVQQLQTQLQSIGLQEPSCGVSAYTSDRIGVDKLTLLEEARYAWLNTSAEKSISAYSAP